MNQPQKDFINVEISGNPLLEKFNLEISDVLGNSIIQGNGTSGSFRNISIKEFSSGIYFVKLISEKGFAVLKFVKE